MLTTTKSESDMTSLAASSPPRSPSKRNGAAAPYFVQSPSRESSHDGEKSTPLYNNSPMDSPSHPSRSSSFGRHSRNSSASRFSGIFRSSSGRKGGGSGGGGGRKGTRSNEKGWPECDVIMEEGTYDDVDKGITRRVQILIALVSFFLVFTVFCLIIWGASRTFKAEITVKSLTVNNFYVGSGTDFSGVPTKMVTVNGSLRLSVYNPATIFGIHVTSTPVNLIYSEITVATGQLKKYYQPRKSRRTVVVNLEGEKVPLYGAGSNLLFSGETGVVNLTLSLEIRSRGNVVGKLVRTKHKRQISCPLVVDSKKTKPIKFKKTSCTYD